MTGHLLSAWILDQKTASCIWNQLSQYSQNYSSFATTYKSLWVQQHSLSLGEGGFPWILLVRFSQTNVFKSNTKTLKRNKMTWNININCHLNYLSCQRGPKSLYVKFVYFCKTRTVFRVFIISIGDWRILCLLHRIPQLTFSSLWPFLIQTWSLFPIISCNVTPFSCH